MEARMVPTEESVVEGEVMEEEEEEYLEETSVTKTLQPLSINHSTTIFITTFITTYITAFITAFFTTSES